VVQSIKLTSSTPKLTHTICADDRPVVGVTSIDNRLFVLRSPSRHHIQVYDTKTFKQQRALSVKDLSDDTAVSGLIACITNNCVYVSDSFKATVHKVELSDTNKAFKWLVDRSPFGLSINTACNLLVASCGANKIQEYTTSGLLVHEVCLESSSAMLRPVHAVQVADDQYVVSRWNTNPRSNAVYDVVAVDREGRLVVNYLNHLKSTTKHDFNYPRHLSVDYKKGYILVADCWNNRIVIMSRSLNNGGAREVNEISVDRGLQEPSCLHFDSSQNRLFVGEGSGQGVLVFDSVI
jgi:DNA-binding beta-propeller fold protein YncE